MKKYIFLIFGVMFGFLLSRAAPPLTIFMRSCSCLKICS